MAATYLVLVLVGMLCTVAMAQSGCTSVLIGLSPCLNYITGTSSTPSQQCCTQLASVVRSSPQCLCQVLNGGGSSLGITINQTQALALPGSCNIQTPPISSCNGKDAITFMHFISINLSLDNLLKTLPTWYQLLHRLQQTPRKDHQNLETLR
ncbi:hypothetical protein GQ457_01G032400 [Hibiscus cannabinus]